MLNGGLYLGRIALEHREADCADDDGAEAKQGACQRYGEVEGQRPHADAVVQIGLLQAPRPAEPQVEGIAEDARMREQAGDERGEQRDADQAHQIQKRGEGEAQTAMPLEHRPHPRRSAQVRSIH